MNYLPPHLHISWLMAFLLLVPARLWGFARGQIHRQWIGQNKRFYPDKTHISCHLACIFPLAFHLSGHTFENILKVSADPKSYPENNSSCDDVLYCNLEFHKTFSHIYSRALSAPARIKQWQNNTQTTERLWRPTGKTFTFWKTTRLFSLGPRPPLLQLPQELRLLGCNTSCFSFTVVHWLRPIRSSSWERPPSWWQRLHCNAL